MNISDKDGSATEKVDSLKSAFKKLFQALKPVKWEQKIASLSKMP